MSQIIFTTKEWKLSEGSETFDEEEFEGLSWTQKMTVTKQNITTHFEFEWDEDVFDGFDGIINLQGSYSQKWTSTRPLPVVLSQNGACASFDFDKKNYDMIRFRFDLTPFPTIAWAVLEPKFQPSAVTDAVLLVKGKRIHVNKGFLIFHSEYFRSLFQSELKEKSMNEIPIEDVKHKDFGRLLLSVYPDPVPLTEESAVPVLELADRFAMPAVIRLVEPIITDMTSMTISKKLLLADKYRLNKLWDSCIATLRNAADMKDIVTSDAYKEFPDSLKAKILDHFSRLN